MDDTPGGRSRRIAIVVERPRAWHERLRARLDARGHDAWLVAEGKAAAPALALLLATEGWIYRAHSALFAEVSALSCRRSSETADLIIRLGGDRPTGETSLCVSYDGRPGEAAMIGVLLAGRVPVVDVTSGNGDVPTMLATGLPAVEDPSVLARALDHVLARVIALVVLAVDRAVEATPIETSETLPGRYGSAVPFFVRMLTRKIMRRLARTGTDHWHVAWRETIGAGVADTLSWPEGPYATLIDDGTAYYADPFPFAHDGRRYIFCEKYPYATGKGVIAAFEIDDEGRALTPRVVLEHDAHLSYPQILTHDGDIFMLPEMGAAGRIELFRAEAFPDRWTAHCVLIDDIVAGDATFIVFEGRCWLFATVSGDGGSSWDQLALFYAPALEGPWQPHCANPVLIDASSARPAGAMWLKDGVLWRVAQDCRAGYGAGLTLCRVDTLDPNVFSQTIVRRLEPPSDLGADGVHTLNNAAGLETIDWRKPRPRPPSP